MRHSSSLILLLLLLTSCAPMRRTVNAVTAVSDTTHVVVHDTIRITQVHDSIVFHASEHIHEQEVTTYDPSTGHPIQHQVTRDTDRDLDALIRHLADSIIAAHDYESSASHAEESTVQEEQETGEAALTPFQLFARRVASIVLLCICVFFVVIAVKVYRRHKDTPCW